MVTPGKELENVPFRELIKYRADQDYQSEGVVFTGVPQWHPNNSDKLLLLSSPFSQPTIFFEFLFQDILHVEEAPSLVTEAGESIQFVNVWIRKGSHGVLLQPFEVREPRPVPKHAFT